MNKRVLIAIGIVVLLAGGAFLFWRGINPKEDSIILREDLPPAPKNFDKLKENKEVVAGFSHNPEFLETFRKEFILTVTNIKEHPDTFIGWMDLGAIKSMFGDYKGAEEAWLYAGLITPNQSRSFFSLGDLYWNRLQEYEKAEWAYLSAIEKGEVALSVAAHRDLATLYRYSYEAKRDLANDVLLQGIELNPDDKQELLALLAEWAKEDGEVEKAIGYYEEYLELNPTNEAAQEDLRRLKAKRE